MSSDFKVKFSLLFCALHYLTCSCVYAKMRAMEEDRGLQLLLDWWKKVSAIFLIPGLRGVLVIRVHFDNGAGSVKIQEEIHAL